MLTSDVTTHYGCGNRGDGVILTAAAFLNAAATTEVKGVIAAFSMIIDLNGEVLLLSTSKLIVRGQVVRLTKPYFR